VETSVSSPITKTEPSLAGRCLAEATGTFVLIFLGCGVVHAAVLTGAHSGTWQVAIVWGVAVMLAIYATAGVSGSHINPAMTLAFYFWRDFPGRLVAPYILAQLAGAMVAAGFLLVLFGPHHEARERAFGVVRGQPGSELTAMCFGEYYPNPGGLEKPWKEAGSSRAELLRDHYAMVSEGAALLAEFLGTMILAVVVFAVTESRNRVAQRSNLAPVFIGLAVAVLISVIAPLTQACFNPARDFGPRLVACFGGWGDVALPGPNGRGFWTVYILAPIVGAIAGGAFYQFLLRPQLAEES
jgi:glycerol uptake facilitator